MSPVHTPELAGRISIRIDEAFLAAIQKLADANERSLAGEIRHALRLHLERTEENGSQ